MTEHNSEQQYQAPQGFGQQQQPGPAYQAPQGYQQPGFQQQPRTPMRPDEERTWALLAHIGTVVLGFIAPLVVLLVKGNESPSVRQHSVESLNFQITVLIGYVISWVLVFVLIGFVLVFAVWAVSVVFAIIATIAASKGEPYKYPFALRLVK